MFAHTHVCVARESRGGHPAAAARCSSRARREPSRIECWPPAPLPVCAGAPHAVLPPSARPTIARAHSPPNERPSFFGWARARCAGKTSTALRIAKSMRFCRPAASLTRKLALSRSRPRLTAARALRLLLAPDDAQGTAARARRLNWGAVGYLSTSRRAPVGGGVRACWRAGAPKCVACVTSRLGGGASACSARVLNASPPLQPQAFALCARCGRPRRRVLRGRW